MAVASEVNSRRSEEEAKRTVGVEGNPVREEPIGRGNAARAASVSGYGPIAQRIVHPPPEKPFKQMTAEEYAYDYLGARGFGSTF
jgi:hypothetical protein